MHSLYFELLPELGLIGVLLVSGAVYSSMKPTSKLMKGLISETKLLRKVGPTFQNQDAKNSSKDLVKECEFASSFIFASNAAFIGLLAGGAFISVLYYPLIWMLFGFSAAGHTYSRNLLNLASQLRKEPAFNEKSPNSALLEQHF